MATLKTQIKLRRDTATNLANVVPAAGEPVYATDTKKFSIGDGSTKFSALKDYGFIPTIPDVSDFVTKSTAQTISGVKTFSTQQKFTVANGTSPFTVTSSTKVANLNADKVDGFDINNYGYKYQSSASISLVRANLVNADAPIYVKMTTNNSYHSQHVRFKVMGGYDNVSGSTEVTSYCRAQNEFYFDSVYYNGNKLVGVYQPSANTNIYYLKFSKFAGSYASNPNTGTITVYAQVPGITLTMIEEGHADYATISSYSYVPVPSKGIYGSHLWNDMYPTANNTNSLGNSSYQWKNIYGINIYENGTSLVSKYQPLDADLTSIAGLTGTSGFLKKTAANTWALDTNTYLTSEADTLQTVTNRGATTTKAIEVAGLTTTKTLYVTGETGHREGIRIAPYNGTLSSIWWNATGVQDYTTGQMWGITAYLPTYSTDTSKQNTFRFRGPSSSTATSATDQMWINTSGLVTSRGGFAKSGSSNSYVLLGGGGTKALSDFAMGSDIPSLDNYVTLDGTQTISGKKTFSGGIAITKADENENMVYFLGIDAFASGGAVRWTNKSDIKLPYSQITGTPTIPTVNNGTLTIQRNGTTVATFTANQAGNTTANITDNDTLNTAGSTNDEAKLYLVGAKSQAASAQTYSDAQVYTEAGELNATTVCVAEHGQMKYDSTNQCIRFVIV